MESIQCRIMRIIFPGTCSQLCARLTFLFDTLCLYLNMELGFGIGKEISGPY